MQSKYSGKIGIIIVAGLFALVTILFIASEVEDREEHLIALDQINQVKQYDILLSENILKLQSGLLNDYDSVVDSSQKIEGLLTPLEESTVHTSRTRWFAVAMHPKFKKLPTLQKNIEDKLVVYQDTFKVRQKNIERFKTLNATLRNSQNSFLVLLDELVLALKKQPDAVQEIIDVQRLLYDESLFLLKDKPGLRKKIQKDIKAVRLIGKHYPDLQKLSHSVARHAEIIVGQEKQIYKIVSDITASTYLKHLNELHDSYNAYSSTLHTISYSYRVMMFGMALILLATVLLIWYRLHKASHQIEKARQSLEQRVEERTSELKKSQERFELAVEGTNDGIWDWPDVNKDEEYWSPQFKKLLGYEEDEIKAGFQEFISHLHEDDVGRIKREVEDHFKNNVPFDTEYRLRVKSGEYQWFHAKGTAVRNDEGQPVRMVGSLSDITFQKANEETLLNITQEIQNSQARLETVLNTVLDGIITIDSKGIIQTVNPAVEEMFHYEAHEIIGHNVKMLMPQNYERKHDKYLQNYLKGGDAKVIGIGREVEAMRRDGSTFPMELGVSEVSISGERMFVGTVRDISQRKQAELDLVEAKDKAEGATQLKSEFLANMSHEIRTPMNGVIGMTNLLLETDLDPTQNTYARTAMGSAENLLQLVNDILDFSKIEAGKMEFEIIPFDLQALVEEVADITAVKAQEDGLEMLLRFAPDMPRYVMGDPGRVRQIFLNLASNALKFTEAGHVLIGVDVEENKNGEVIFRGYVEDTGIGIPEDKQDLVFNKFSQADGSTTRKFGGTGLGLAICKELTHMMKGDIGLDSISGVGSTFWFTFCLVLDENADERDTLDFSTDLSGVRAIIVDDNKIAQDIAAEQMQKASMDITITASGEEGLAAMRTAAKDSKPYEIAVLDYMMPGMDGLELAQAIKSDEALKDTSLLMVSSAPNRGDNERMQDIGFNGYLTKPASGFDIIRALSAIQSMREGKSEFTMITRHTLRESNAKKDDSEAENLSFNGAQILLAEDNPTNQLVATTMLEKMGCHVTPAGNGLEAVKLVKQRRFDLIFMDCNMPEMDGFEATQTIHNLEERNEFDKTPIVAFTAYAMKGDDQKCYDAGMDDYITKPVKKQAMVSVLKKWLDRKETQTAGNEEEAPIKEGQCNEIDLEVLEQMKELMGDKFNAMIEKYLENSAQYIAQAEEALANNNAKGLADATHPLKSSSASLGVMKVSELAADIEYQADAINESGKGDLVSLSLVLQELIQFFAESRDFFKKNGMLG